MSLSVHLFKSNVQIMNVSCGSTQEICTTQHSCAARTMCVRLRYICEFSYLCWCPLWPVWTELLGSGPAKPARCTAATAGSSAGKSWCPNTATRWKVQPGKQTADGDKNHFSSLQPVRKQITGYCNKLLSIL